MTSKLMLAASVAAMTMAGGIAAAQETTGAIRGTVTDETGMPLAGADVTITDVRTGQTRNLTTNSDGGFRAGSLPVTGRFTVTAAESGYISESLEGIIIQVGGSTDLTFDLASGGGDVIIVTGTATSLVQVAPGPSTVFTQADIQDLPSTSRDIKDIIQLDPRILIDETNGDAIQCAGANNRVNSITIDGYAINDTFGLNANGYPTQRLPYPFDVTEQVALEIAPFDVEYGGFTGCNFNVVTRSGSNEFSGGFSFDYLGEDFNGDSLEGEEVFVEQATRESTSFYLTGPIIRNRLFFTLGYEYTEDEDTANVELSNSNGNATVNDLFVSDLEEIQQISQDVYGFDAGDIPNAGIAVEDERLFVKLDAYLTETQRLELGYQYTDGSNISDQSTGGNDVGLTSHYYLRGEELTVYSARLFSEWSDRFSTEARIAYQDRVTTQQPLGDNDFAQMEITVTDAEGEDGTVSIGPDQFRHANELENQVFDLKLKGDLQLDRQLLTFGYEMNSVEVFNLFVDQSQGLVEFDSIDDFRNQAPSIIEYENAATNNPADAAAEFETRTHVFYGQSVFDWRPNVSVTAGLRVDLYDVPDAPSDNQTFEDRYGFSNASTLDGLALFQPRLAVDWQVDSDLSVFGGVGLFSGGNPGVWVSNAYSNSGDSIGAAESEDPAVINGFNGFDIPQELQDEVTASANSGNGFVDAVDPDFEVPSVLRFSVGADYQADLSPIKLGDGWRLAGDLIYGITHNPVEWQALNLIEVGQAPDGRPIYETQDLLDPDCSGARNNTDASLADGDCSSRLGGSGASDLLLTNSDENPTQFVASFGMENRWELDNGIDLGFMFFYAYTDAEDVNPGTSSTSTSNWENFSTSNFNRSDAATSNYETAHRFTTRFTSSWEWKPGWRTSATFFGTLQEGRPFSYTYEAGRARDGFSNGGNLFGDTDASEDRSLLYVPTGCNDPLVICDFDNAAEEAEFLAFINSDDLKEYQGEIAPRNAFTSDWYGQVDLRLTQRVPLPGMLGDDRLRFIVDVDNLTNLINDEWGVRRDYGFEYNVPVVEAELSDNGQQYVYTGFNDLDQRVRQSQSLWEIQFGLRYDF